MKRILLLGVPLLVLVLAAAWFYGRAPSLYVLEQECRRYHQGRKERLSKLEQEFVLAQRAADRGGDAEAKLARLGAERDELLAGTATRRIRGWEVAFIPPGGRGPDPEGYLVARRLAVAEAGDPALLQGEVEIWVRPSGPLARLLHGWGLTP